MHEFVKSPYTHKFTSGCMRAWQTSAYKLILWDNFYILWYITLHNYYRYTMFEYILLFQILFLIIFNIKSMV